MIKMNTKILNKQNQSFLNSIKNQMRINLKKNNNGLNMQMMTRSKIDKESTTAIFANISKFSKFFFKQF